jgi:hypothetical protein
MSRDMCAACVYLDGLALDTISRINPLVQSYSKQMLTVGNKEYQCQAYKC